MTTKSKSKQLLKMYLGDMVGLKEIGKKIHNDPRTFKKEITSFGIIIPHPGAVWTKVKKHIAGHFFIPIPNSNIDMITGLILGDAQLRVQTKAAIHNFEQDIEKYAYVLSSIRNIQAKVKQEIDLSEQDVKNWNASIKLIKNTNTANLRIHKSILELTWVKVLAKKFKEFIPIRLYIKKNRTKSTKWSCGFDTQASVQFFNLWQHWYKINEQKTTKVLANIKKLTPNILLHWYVDDGYISKSELALCSHNFNLAEQRTLLKFLDREGIQAKIKKRKTKYFISISFKKANREHFFDYIKQAELYNEAVECLPYKFSATLRKREWIKEIKSKHPAYFQEGEEIKKQLIKELTTQ